MMTEVIDHTFYTIRGEVDQIEALVKETLTDKVFLFGDQYNEVFKKVPVEELTPAEKRVLVNLEDPEAAELAVLAKKKNLTVEEKQRLADAGYRWEEIGPAVVHLSQKQLGQLDFS